MGGVAAQAPPSVLRKPDTPEAVVLRRIWERVNRRNEHFMGAIVGEEGSGKSHTAIAMANLLDDTFNVDRIIYDIADLLQVLRDGEHDPGNAYVLDEAGIEFGVRTWQQRSQVLANQVLQLIRDENLMLFFTIPALGDLDSQSQRRLQAFFEITNKSHNEFVEGKWKYIDPDRADVTGKNYQKFPIIEVGNGPPAKYRSLQFPHGGVPDDLLDAYEDKKTAFQQRVYDKTITELRDEDLGDDDSSSFDAKEMAKSIAEDGVEAVTSIHGAHKTEYIDADLIQIEYDLSTRKASQVKKLLERDHTPEMEA